MNAYHVGAGSKRLETEGAAAHLVSNFVQKLGKKKDLYCEECSSSPKERGCKQSGASNKPALCHPPSVSRGLQDSTSPDAVCSTGSTATASRRHSFMEHWYLPFPFFSPFLSFFPKIRCVASQLLFFSSREGSNSAGHWVSQTKSDFEAKTPDFALLQVSTLPFMHAFCVQ